MLANTDYLEELVKNKLISYSAANKVRREHPRFVKYSLQSFWSALNKAKGKYQFHSQPPMKKAPPSVHVEVIEKGPLADMLTGSLFGTMEAGMKAQAKS